MSEFQRALPPLVTLPAESESARSGESFSTKPDSSRHSDFFTAAQRVWLGVLTRMAMEYPSSEYAKMPKADLSETARVWADSLSSVPVEAIRELYRRVNAKWTSTWAPNIGDFRAIWFFDPDWDYWAEANKNPEADFPAAAIGALMPAPEGQPGPGFRCISLQMDFLRLTGAMVCCPCLNEYGFKTPAAFSMDETKWVCAVGVCDFSKPVEEPEKARPQEASEVVTANDSSTRASLFAEQAGLNYETDLNDEQKLAMRKMATWWDLNRRKVTPENFEALWNEFHDALAAVA